MLESSRTVWLPAGWGTALIRYPPRTAGSIHRQLCPLELADWQDADGRTPSLSLEVRPSRMDGPRGWTAPGGRPPVRPSARHVLRFPLQRTTPAGYPEGTLGYEGTGCEGALDTRLAHTHYCETNGQQLSFRVSESSSVGHQTRQSMSDARTHTHTLREGNNEPTPNTPVWMIRSTAGQGPRGTSLQAPRQANQHKIIV